MVVDLMVINHQSDLHGEGSHMLGCLCCPFPQTPPNQHCGRHPYISCRQTHKEYFQDHVTQTQTEKRRWYVLGVFIEAVLTAQALTHSVKTIQTQNQQKVGFGTGQSCKLHLWIERSDINDVTWELDWSWFPMKRLCHVGTTACCMWQKGC